MSINLKLLERINKTLAQPSRPQSPPRAPQSNLGEQLRKLQDSLSGALKEKVTVRLTDGTVFAEVPMTALLVNGLRIAESVIPGVSPVVTGTLHAMANAERRVGKLCGENHGARMVDFNADTKHAIFEVIRVETEIHNP